jgi:hypothetical protein
MAFGIQFVGIYVWIYICMCCDELITRPRSPTVVYKLELNSVILVRKRTITTERPPLVGEVSAIFS